MGAWWSQVGKQEERGRSRGEGGREEEAGQQDESRAAISSALPTERGQSRSRTLRLCNLSLSWFCSLLI
jgi:hypothetical protein